METWPCAVCGAERNAKVRFETVLINGGGSYAHPDSDDYDVNDAGFMGIHPVGSGCARKPEVKPHVKRVK